MMIGDGLDEPADIGILQLELSVNGLGGNAPPQSKKTLVGVNKK